jgi:hypothetical protein
MVTLSREQLESALEELVDELVIAGVAARVRVVGGAAIVLAHNPDRAATRDVDAVLADPADAVLAAARCIAERRKWPADWLNTDAMIYSPDPDHPEPAWEMMISRGGVTVEVGSATYLLAMKLHAARGRRDTDDIATLVGRCRLSSVEAAIELYEAHYRADPLPERALATLRRLLG